jgi:hypothetical protein
MQQRNPQLERPAATSSGLPARSAGVHMRRKLLPWLMILFLVSLCSCRARNQYVRIVASHTDPLINIPVDRSRMLDYDPLDARSLSFALAEQDLDDAKQTGVPLVVEIKINPTKGVVVGDFWLAFLDDKGQEMESKLKLGAGYFQHMRCVAVRFPQAPDAEAQKWQRITQGPAPVVENKGNVELMFLMPKGLQTRRALLKFLSMNNNQRGPDAQTGGSSLEVVGPFELNQSKGWFD